MQHLRTHTVSKRFQCKHCHKSFSRSTDCHTHMMKHAGEKLHLQCRQCDKTFSQDSEFQFHMNTHITPNSDQCCKCGKSSSLVYDITYLRSHTAEKPYMCRKCENDFSVSQPILHNQTYQENLTFKGLKFENTDGDNLCYIMQLLMHFSIFKQ